MEVCNISCRGRYSPSGEIKSQGVGVGHSELASRGLEEQENRGCLQAELVMDRRLEISKLRRNQARVEDYAHTDMKVSRPSLKSRVAKRVLESPALSPLIQDLLSSFHSGSKSRHIWQA
jgi:hypothetical protein